MNEPKLIRTLRTIGLTCFVKYLPEVGDLDAGSRASIAALMQDQEGWTEPSCKTRVSAMRRIIASGSTNAALRLIADSVRIPSEVAIEARNLIGVRW